MTTPETETFTLAEVAERTHIAPTTLLRLCRAGKVKCVKVGRSYSMTPSQVAELLDQFTRAKQRDLTPRDADDIDRQRVMAEVARKPKRRAA